VTISGTDALELAKTDFAGLHQQHAASWTSFNTTLQIVILVEALPWAAAGTLLGKSNSGDFISLLVAGAVLPVVLLFTGLAGAVGYGVLVNNRLTIVFYAQALNGYRAMLAPVFPVAGFLPTSTTIPPRRDWSGIMGLLVWSLTLLNATYLGLAVYSLARTGPANACGPIGAGIGTAIVALATLLWWYFYITSEQRPTPVSRPSSADTPPA
jgi:hypothetical protein